MQKNKVGLIY
uniref:Uncharacterized protein n=1 Tax=Pyxicephalus adspersus TaxID=30357 RepID=A0A499QZ42_PYXAD|nr:hypothetical protein maker-66O13-exonerate_protein2genome-gene-0.11 [Pyxicephalus adspersus]